MSDLEQSPADSAVDAAVVNMARHARTNIATVGIEAATGLLRLTVSDDSETIAPWTPGVGLESTRDRAEQIGAPSPSRAAPVIEAGLPLDADGAQPN